MDVLHAVWYIRTSREALGLCIVLEVIFIELITEAVVIGYVDREWRVWKGFPSGLESKESAMQETQVQSWIRKISWEKGMATHLTTLAWRIPKTEEPGRLQSLRLQRVGHDWASNRHTCTHTHTECGKKGALHRHLSWRRDRGREGRSVSGLMTKYWGVDHFKG